MKTLTSMKAIRNAIAPPEPNLTAEEMIARAAALRPTLRERQARTEAAGRLLEETNQDFLDAGFYRILQPRIFGGYEFRVADFARVMMEVSRGCMESGWVLSLTSGHPAAFIAAFPEEAQRFAYKNNGDCRVPGVAAPGGVALPHPEGFILNGAWDYASGCDVATHFLGAVMRIDPETKTPLAYSYALIDRSEFTIIDNWNVMGMRGTGSKRVAVKDLVIPAVRLQDFATGDLKQEAEPPGRALFANPLYRGPYIPLLYTELAAVVVGGARGALDMYDELMRTRKWNLPPFTPRSEMTDTHYRFGRAQALVDTAEAALLHLAPEYDAICRRKDAGHPHSPEDERRFMGVAQQCFVLCWEAVDMMFRSAGTSATRTDSPLNRYYRNMAMIRTHVTQQFDHTAANIARLHFGMEPISPL